ncbi:hypothetical protein E2H86_08870 [Pseudomonas putida]|uniref:hypothetical protein n=1 Tax=Pseudomonas putida TaxID=303 RepID=UPI001059C180|nr:hypothetical protein [Pseudomonas putida]TDJ77285.1 hypothetical protein E2H86_08870 [Pseudomonas putida]
MTEVLAFLGRALWNLFLEVVFWFIFYWLGWPVVKLATFGRMPKGNWRRETTERNWVSCVGIAVFAFVIMGLWDQVSFSHVDFPSGPVAKASQ